MSGTTPPITTATLIPAHPAAVARPVAATSQQPVPAAPQQATPIQEPAAPPPDKGVMVQAVRSFMGSEGIHAPTDPPFEVTRQRAADLFANDLVRFVSPADEDAMAKDHVDTASKAAHEGISLRRMMRRNTREGA